MHLIDALCDISGCRPMRGVARAPRSTRGPPRDREGGRRANLRSSSRTNSAANLQCDPSCFRHVTPPSWLVVVWLTASGLSRTHAAIHWPAAPEHQRHCFGSNRAPACLSATRLARRLVPLFFCRDADGYRSRLRGAGGDTTRTRPDYAYQEHIPTDSDDEEDDRQVTNFCICTPCSFRSDTLLECVRVCQPTPQHRGLS
jgi:hypothetical protein